jgi:hypothetical protein
MAMRVYDVGFGDWNISIWITRDDPRLKEMIDWCKDMLSNDQVYVIGSARNFYFKNYEDASQFIMKWQK